MMLKDIIKKIESAIPNPFPVDASRFQDPVALQTDWKGVRSGKSGASSKLVLKDANLLAYKPSIAGQIMGLIFFLVGALVVWIYFNFPGDKPWFMLLIGPLFALGGIMIIIQATSPLAFDKSIGLFYKGRRQQKQADASDAKHAARFSDIHAIQLLSRLESSSNNDTPTRYYRVYEMNLVKHDGQRIHIMTYGQDEKAREDARTIADFVHVPVWDGIDG